MGSAFPRWPPRDQATVSFVGGLDGAMSRHLGWVISTPQAAALLEISPRQEEPEIWGDLFLTLLKVPRMVATSCSTDTIHTVCTGPV